MDSAAMLTGTPSLWGHLRWDIWLRILMMGEMVFFSSLFCMPLPRKKRFWLRLLLTGALLAAFVCLWNPEWSRSNPFLAMAYTSFQMAGLYGMILLCFEATPEIGIFGTIGGIVGQRILMHFAMILSPLLRIHPMVLEFAGMAFLYALGYQVFTRPIKKRGYRHMGSKVNISIALVFPFGSVMLTALGNYYGQGMPMLEPVLRGYDFICCLFALILLWSVFLLEKAAEDAQTIQRLREQEGRQMRISQETIDMINIKCHDMKHLLSLIENKGVGGQEEELEKIRTWIDSYDQIPRTGNDTLDQILTEKEWKCQEKGIRIQLMADGKWLRFMNDADIYALFGNILDNAIEAVDKIEEANKRIVYLDIREVAGMVWIRIENYYVGEIQMKDGIPLTKEDRRYHGYGFRSIRLLVGQYEGSLKVETKDGIFTLTILLPIQESQG